MIEFNLELCYNKMVRNEMEQPVRGASVINVRNELNGYIRDMKNRDKCASGIQIDMQLCMTIGGRKW